MKMTKRAPFFSFLALGLALAGCAGGPPPAVFVLDEAPRAAPAPQMGGPRLEIRPVRVPDYLDTTDIVARKGNQIVARETARWGERLSAGLTRALSAALAERLPQATVGASGAFDRPARELLVDVSAFEADADGQVVLRGRFTLIDGAARKTLREEGFALAAPLEGESDAQLVAAMAAAVRALADRLAPVLSDSLAARSGSAKARL